VLNLKESICLAIIHLQKISDRSAGTNKITSTLLGCAQAVDEADAWKKAQDASAVGGAPYIALVDTKLQHLFRMIEGSSRLKKQWLCLKAHAFMTNGLYTGATSGNSMGSKKVTAKKQML